MNRCFFKFSRSKIR